MAQYELEDKGLRPCLVKRFVVGKKDVVDTYQMRPKSSLLNIPQPAGEVGIKDLFIPTLSLSTTLIIITSSSLQPTKPTHPNTNQNVHHILKMFASTILSTLAVLALATTGMAAPQAGAATPKTGTAASTPQTGAGAAAAAACTYQKINTLSVCTAEGLCSGNTGACPKANFPNGDAQDTSSKQLNLDICMGQPVGAKCQQTIACCP